MVTLIIPSAEDMVLEQDRRFEEVWINSKKYMIPGCSVRLDFLHKVHSLRRTHDADTSALRYGLGTPGSSKLCSRLDTFPVRATAPASWRRHLTINLTFDIVVVIV